MKGQIALVTGASRGIGQSIAVHLAKKEVTLYLTQHRQPLTETLEKVSPFTEAHIIPGEISSYQSCQEIIARIKKEKGALHILVNSAGITRDGLVVRMKEADMQEVMAVNFFAPVYLMKESLKLMLPQHYGRIVNIGSVVGIRANPGQANYAASKAALLAFSQSLAKEVATRHITVNVLAPGFIETAMTEALALPQKEKILQNIPMGHFGKVDDVAALACFLCSPQAGYITGQAFIIDGGLTL